MKPMISLEAAHGRDRVIANSQGQIPWQLPADRRHWRELVAGHAIIVGETTYRQQGTLEDSFNIVVTHDITQAIPKGAAAGSVEAALAIARGHEDHEIFVVGGASIFEQTIHLAQRLYLTIVDLEVPDPGRYFPEYENDFRLIKAEPGQDNGLKFRFTVWERR